MTDLRQAFLFACDAMNGAIRPWQDPYEFLSLLSRVQQSQPKVIVELGTMNGGTLFMCSRVAADDALLISIDLPHGIHGGGYPRFREPLYRWFARARQRLELMRADSHQPRTLDRLKDTLAGRSIDFLFIDGDHTYQGVKQDFEMYSPLVRRGGLVAFHDTVVHLEKEKCQVDQFWKEINGRYPHEEFVQTNGGVAFGIGLITMP